MKTALLLLVFIVAIYSSCFAEDNTTTQHRPFGFGAFGMGEQVTWLKSDANIYTNQGETALTLESTNQGIVYFTGSMAKITQQLSAYIQVASTLIANESDARISSSVEYSNSQVSYLLTNASLTLLYDLSEYQSFLFGGSYEYQGIRYFPDNSDFQDNVTIEDDVSILTVEVGYMFRNKEITGDEGWHFWAGGLLGLPFFNYQATSSSYVVGDEQHYGFNTGVSAKVFGYAGYTVIEGLEIGLDVHYLYRFRNVGYSFKYNDPIKGSYEIKTNTASLNRLVYMLVAAYNF